MAYWWWRFRRRVNFRLSKIEIGLVIVVALAIADFFLVNR